MLLLPLFGWFARLRQRMGARASLAIVGVEALLLLGQWAIFVVTLQGDYETAAVYLPFPVLILAVQVLA
jgi:hypothetical protein